MCVCERECVCACVCGMKGIYDGIDMGCVLLCTLCVSNSFVAVWCLFTAMNVNFATRFISEVRR